VQGLRALAVLAVVMFHARLPVPGGFVGVDVFFVISGFVITGMLMREFKEQGRIRFGRFYLRRFKRLTPALALMVATVMAISAFTMSPLGPQQVSGQTAIAAMLFCANFVIANVTGGYFDAPADQNPFLNTWSLSVEEQFYFVFPALLAACWVYARRVGNTRFPHTVVRLVIVSSLFVAFWGVAHPGGTLAGFYSPYSRAWEFAVGAAIALNAGRLGRLRKVDAARATLLGGAMVVASFFLISGTTPFPGPWTLLPVFGTALLITGGTRAEASPVTRTLMSPTMVRIGDWSYSIYLWHWPLIVISMTLWPTTAWAPLAAAIVSFVPAALSYHLVEEPLRRRNWGVGPRRKRSIGMVFAVPVMLAAVVWTIAANYWEPRYAQGQVASDMTGDVGDDAFYAYLAEHFTPCENVDLLNHAQPFRRIQRCYQSRPGPVDTVLLGDSHAEHLFVGLAEQAPARNVAYYIVNGSPIPSDPQFNYVLNMVAQDQSIRTFVVNSHWRRRGTNEAGLRQTLHTLTQGGRQVFMTDDGPNFAISTFGCKYGQTALHIDRQCSNTNDGYRTQNRRIHAALAGVAADVPGVTLMGSAKYFCNGATCSMTNGKTLLYRNAGHLNVDGSRYIVKLLIRDNPTFDQALGLS